MIIKDNLINYLIYNINDTVRANNKWEILLLTTIIEKYMYAYDYMMAWINIFRVKLF